MKKIPLTQGKFALVDDEDFDELSKWAWYPHGAYARRHINKDGRIVRRVYMHRSIMREPELEVDHINGDGLDNRKSNLRVCTHAENLKNQITVKNSLSGVKGVSLNRRDNKWTAYIKTEGKKIFLGNFENKQDAQIAYNVASVKHFGEFAKIHTI